MVYSKSFSTMLTVLLLLFYFSEIIRIIRSTHRYLKHRVINWNKKKNVLRIKLREIRSHTQPNYSSSDSELSVK